MTSRLAMLIALLWLTPTAHAQNDTPARFQTGLEGRSVERPRRSERVDFNLEDGDLMDLVRMMTTITGYRFIITGSPRALSATVASAEPVNRLEAYRAFLAILNLNGLTVVRRGRYHVIVDSQEMSRRPTAILDDESLPNRDERFVTWIHRLRHMPVSEARQLLDGLRSSEGSIVPYEPTQTLIVIDTGANIHRMRNILRTIDVAQSDAHVWVEPIHFANATDMATSLGAILGETPASARATPPARQRARRPGQPAQATAPSPAVGVQHAPIRFLADERTNSLIIIGTAPEYRRAIELLRELDQRDRESSATVRVRRLQNADAAAVATTLQSLLSGPSGATGGSAAANATPNIQGLRGSIRVEAHEAINALVITATPADYRAIAQLIDELDVAPRQVFLEMVLMELTVDDEDSLGLDLLGGLGGLLGPDTLGLLANVASGGASSALGGLTLGLLGPNVPGTSTRSFGVEMQALAGAQQTNVIATPYVLALDNREATINVGESVPLQGSNVAGVPNVLTQTLPPEVQQVVNGASAPSASGGRRDTGTIVTVTPHVNDAGQIRLELEVEDSRQGARVGNLDASVVSQSIAQTELVAQDGQTVVIGGMMRDSVVQTQSGLPVLSQIPILGALFGTQSQRTERRNLLFFITPHVVRGPRDIRAIFERRMRERREFLQRHMAFSDAWRRPVDYSRTRGLVSEMLDTVAEVEAEAEAAAVVPDPDPVHVPRAPVGGDELADERIDDESADELGGEDDEGEREAPAQ